MKLVNTDNNKEFRIDVLIDTVHPKRVPVNNLGFSGVNPQSNILLGFSGGKSNARFTIRVQDATSDVANGTHSSLVLARDNQVVYLKQHFCTDDVTVPIQVVGVFEQTKTGRITSVIPEGNRGDPFAYNVRLEFEEGIPQ